MGTNTAPACIADLRAMLNRYVAGLDRMPRTCETYEKAVNRYFEWCDATGCTGTERADVKAFKAYLMANRSPSTVHSYLTAIRGFFAWMHAEYGTPDITAGIRGKKADRGFKKDSLEPAEVRRILRAIDHGTEMGLRDAALITLLASCGLRVIEAARADVGDIVRIAGGRYLMVQGKGREEKDARVRIPPRAAALLDAYIAVRGIRTGSAPLFVSTSRECMGRRLSVRSVSKIVKVRMQAVGLDGPRLTAHSLRHTAVTSALKAGADIREVAQMARHANIQTTLIYAHDLEREANRAEILADRYLFGEVAEVPSA